MRSGIPVRCLISHSSLRLFRAVRSSRTIIRSWKASPPMEDASCCWPPACDGSESKPISASAAPPTLRSRPSCSAEVRNCSPLRAAAADAAWRRSASANSAEWSSRRTSDSCRRTAGTISALRSSKPISERGSPTRPAPSPSLTRAPSPWPAAALRYSGLRARKRKSCSASLRRRSCCLLGETCGADGRLPGSSPPLCSARAALQAAQLRALRPLRAVPGGVPGKSGGCDLWASTSCSSWLSASAKAV
mmetsp:Transcript_93200/g.278226  ORF Transcript_93200/g.278226 Transcript_93200/m.278226 type:complete len:248 (-) Transcript_93200:446-1189(-)